MAETKPEMKRDSTMQVTAKEGIKFLKDAGETVLLAMQDLQSEPPDDGVPSVGEDSLQKTKLHRDSTMAVTIKEGEQFLKDNEKKNNNDALPDSEKSSTDAKKAPETKKGKAKMTKTSTMMQTKKEGEAFLASQAENVDKETEKLKEEPPSKKAKVEKADKAKQANSKRVNTILRTAKEGEDILKRMGVKNPNSQSDSERRVTRAQARGEPTPAPAPPASKKNTKQNNAKEEPKKRGRAKKVVTPEPEEEDDEAENEEEEDMEVDKKKDESEPKKENDVKNDKTSGKKETGTQKKKNNVAVQKKKSATIN